MNPIAIRMLSQQLICQQYSSPAEVVSYMGAIQAQDYPHTNNGIFFPVIVHDGVVCGNWSPWNESLKTDLFRPVDGRCRLTGCCQWIANGKTSVSLS